jgi:glutamine cyclotransferase
VQQTPTNQSPVNNATTKTPDARSVPVYTYEIVNTYKHDPKAFTQGLVFHEGWLYESDGKYDNSSLRKVRLETGEVEKKRKLANEYFAEGMTILNGKIYQITWKERTCFVYDLNTFEPAGRFSYNFDGWGLTNDGTNLILSDGSHQIRFIDPSNFHVLRTINVFNPANNRPLFNLNELEFIKGEIWANIWHSEDQEILGKSNYIARIDPKDGGILGWIDLNGISPEDVSRDPENTLNGIAYDQATDRIFVTGKNWKKLFEIKIKVKNS